MRPRPAYQYTFLRRTGASSGTTLFEILAVLAVVALLFPVLVPIPQSRRTKARAERISCVMNLKNIGMAVRQPFESQDDASPPKTGFAFAEFEPPGPSHPPTPTNNAFFVFLALSNRLTTPKILICPADHRKLATNTWQWATLPTSDSARNPSYFAGTSPRLERPQDILAGDRNLLIPSVGLDFKAASNYNRIVSISWADIPPAYSPNLGWSRELHNSGGNVLLSDGSVQQESNGRVQDQLRDTLNVSTNGIELFFPAL